MLMSGTGRAARLHYLPGTFRVLSNGDHVICAVNRRSHSAARASLLERRQHEAYFGRLPAWSG